MQELPAVEEPTVSATKLPETFQRVEALTDNVWVKGEMLDLAYVDRPRAEMREGPGIQEEIQNIERKAAAGTVRSDELDDRLELFEEADRIIGKPIVDIEGDETLAQLSAGLDLIVKPNLPRAVQDMQECLWLSRLPVGWRSGP